jgi:hypothetical protein
MLAVRFIWELGLLAALAYWGLQATDTTAVNVVLGIAAAAAAAVVWGTFLAPKRRIKLPVSARTAIELTLFGIGSLALWAAGQPVLAVVFAAVAVVQRIALGNGDRLEQSLHP